MPLQLLLLLILLGPGSSLRPWETWEDGAKEAPGRLLARGRRQVVSDEEFDTYDQYEGTDPPEMLENNPGAMTPSSRFQAVMGTLGHRGSAQPGTPEPATLGVATGYSVGLDARGAATGNLSTELAMQGIPVTLGPLTTERVTTIPPIMEAPSTEGAASAELATAKATSVEPAVTEALTTQPAATEALSTRPAAAEALTTQPAATEALTTQPAATEALTTQPAATEALTMQPAATEALPRGPAAIETLSTEPAATAAPPTEPTTTEILSKDPATMKAPSTRPATTRGLTTALLVPSDTPRGSTVAVSNSSDGFIKQWLPPRSSVSPSPTGDLDYIPVKHCLLAIFILALIATTFLVCTVVLAVRLSRQKHMYPVRSYSPTEMVCISSLLPEGGEGPTVTANGSLPATKSPCLKEGSGEDRDGDDLTLHSFLP